MVSCKQIAGRNLPAILLAASLFSASAAAETIRIYGVDGGLGEYDLVINQNGKDATTYFAGVLEIAVEGNGAQYLREAVSLGIVHGSIIGSAFSGAIYMPSQISQASVQRISWLIDNALAPELNPGAPTALANKNWAKNKPQAAGLQLAVWDILFDNGDGFSAGSIQAPTDKHARHNESEMFAWAATYESLSAGQNSDLAFVYDSLAGATPMLLGPAYKDGGPTPLGAQIPAGPSAPDQGGGGAGAETPEPASLGLTGAALLALGCLARSRRVRSHTV